MPSALVARLDLDKLYPGFLEPLLETLAACEKRGARYVATYGYRSVDDQERLYAKGRTAPGPRVTNARGGLSTHNYGIACDVVRDADPKTPKLEPQWGTEGYSILAEEGRRRGLQVGVPGLSDPGHLQLALRARLGKQEVALLEELRLAARTGGLKAAWAKLDAWGFRT